MKNQIYPMLAVLTLCFVIAALASAPMQTAAEEAAEINDLRDGGVEPALELIHITQFELEWNDGGSGGVFNGAFYRPVVPSGFHALGHYGQDNYFAPEAGVFAARELVPGALAAPIDYVAVWGDQGSGAAMDGSFWNPVPQAGYICLGLVAQHGYSKPGLDEVRCVRQDLTLPGKIGPMIWTDQGTGADANFGSWAIVPEDETGVNTGVFTGHASHSPPTYDVFVIDRTRLKVEPQTEALELAYVTDFELEWWDKGSGGDFNGAFYRPVVPTGYHALGHYGQENYALPNGGIFVAHELEPGALVLPIDYALVWSDHGSGADMDGSFWRPIPPPGHICLGLVAQHGYSKPGLDEVRCVRQDLTLPGKIGPMIWTDQGTGADANFGSWAIVPEDETGVNTSVFTGRASHSPPTYDVFVIDRARLKVEPQTEALELAYVTDFELEWWDKGSGGDFNGAFYRPVVPTGYHALGHYGQANYALPSGGIFVAHELEPGALVLPIDYALVWSDHGSGADMDGSFWRPIPPPGHICLGLVAQHGYSKPDLDEVRCVRQDLTRSGEPGPMIWADQGTGADANFSSWSIVSKYETGLNASTFTGHSSHGLPSFNLFVLDRARIKQETPTPALELAYITDYELEWWDKGSGGDFNGAYYRPVVPTGYHALGHYGQENYAAPLGPMFAARELEAGALAPPVDYVKVWGDHGSGADMDGSFWKPIPKPGYACLGLVAQHGYTKPDLDEIRCIRQDLACLGKLGSMIWIDRGTGADTDFGSWRVIPDQDNAIYVGTFTGYPSHVPQADILFGLDAGAVLLAEDSPTAAEVDGLIQAYGPKLLFHSDETYRMDDPEWVLDHGATLQWALVENEWDYDAHNQKHLSGMNTSAQTLAHDFDYVMKNIKPNPPYNDSNLFRIWLNIPDSSKAGNQTRAKTFVRVLPWNSFFTEIQFWMFYPFNGPGRVEVCSSSAACDDNHLEESGRHYGDWEHVTLRFLNSNRSLVSVFMSAHGDGHWFGAGDLGTRMQLDGTHPLVYAAKFSHAHYPTEGRHFYKRVWSKDWGLGTASGDLFDLTDAHSPYLIYMPGNYRVISSELFPVHEPSWLRYSARWGQYEQLSDDVHWGEIDVYTFEEVGAGPSGPAMKTAWNLGDFADENNWPEESQGQEWQFAYMPTVLRK